MTTRREFIGWGAAGLAGAAFLPARAFAAGAARFKVGVTDWNLELEGKVAAIALAKPIGFDGVQVSLGKGDDKLPLADPALQKAYLDESKKVGCPSPPSAWRSSTATSSSRTRWASAGWPTRSPSPRRSA